MHWDLGLDTHTHTLSEDVGFNTNCQSYSPSKVQLLLHTHFPKAL